ncbi:hypothetical protein WMY93_007398 [Mugilogobius chulae]|uniref:G domain-containing protein n=1 Tax=Mugilogobius chulae TaxID=88201 RepID=A0AAW0PG96_9GOBI
MGDFNINWEDRSARQKLKQITDKNNAELLQELTEYEPQNEEVKHLRVLVYGPVGAGKSSLINSIATALMGRMAIPAAANNTQADEGSFTVQFNPKSSISPSDALYNPNPKPDDKAHVLVLLLSANCPGTDPSVIQKMKEVREAARDLGIPQIAIGTHIDEMCEEIEKDLTNVYKSESLKKKMEIFSSEVGITVNCIMAVKNYSEEMKNNPDMDTLILTALKYMVDFGDDFIEEM